MRSFLSLGIKKTSAFPPTLNHVSLDKLKSFLIIPDTLGIYF